MGNYLSILGIITNERFHYGLAKRHQNETKSTKFDCLTKKAKKPRESLRIRGAFATQVALRN